MESTIINSMGRQTFHIYSMPPLLTKIKLIPTQKLVLTPFFFPLTFHWGIIVEILMTMMTPTTSNRLHLAHTKPQRYMKIKDWWRKLTGQWPLRSSSVWSRPRHRTATLLTLAPTYQLMDPTESYDPSTMRVLTRYLV